MSINNKELQQLSIADIFSTGPYIIPMYQRNYAWGKIEIDQLIDDVYNFWKEHKKSDGQRNYYLGTLVVFERLIKNDKYYETIDGQQRLTTINIILAVLKNIFGNLFDSSEYKPVIQFENRITSSEAIRECFEGDFNMDILKNPSIIDAYYNVKSKVLQIYNGLISEVDKGINFINFVNCFLTDVSLIVINLPDETELNHYFEIMNNRGEQLEMHEILKARFLSYINGVDEESKAAKRILSLIWDGCSNMNIYIQESFKPKKRSLIFGVNWDEFNVDDFDGLMEIFKDSGQDDAQSETISDILSLTDSEIKQVNIEFDQTKVKAESDRFASVINFQNFLAHVLFVIKKGEALSLDDKKLIENFEFIKEFSEEERKIFVKEFCFSLLKLRFLLDQFVIKREVQNENEGWSLKRLCCYSLNGKETIQFNNTFGDDGVGTKNENKEISLLLSMFHTGIPGMTYKYWLNGVLKYLFEEFSRCNSICPIKYKNYLFNFAKSFVYKRFLTCSEIDYVTLIYNPSSYYSVYDDYDLGKYLNYKSIKNNFVFNFIDYLFWLKINKSSELDDIAGIKEFAQRFEFTFRSSIEHYFPQHPIDGSSLKDEFLNSIGNLSLVSHSKNSAMGNYLPKAKKEHYKNGKSADSIKQFIMFNKYPDKSWGEIEIKNHQEEVVNILEECANNKLGQ